MEEKPAAPPTAAKAPVEEKPASPPAAAKAPVEEKPAAPPTAAKAPVEEKPASPPAAAKAPVEEKPAAPPTAAKAPVEEKPASPPAAAKAPVEEKPASPAAVATSKPTDVKLPTSPTVAATPAPQEAQAPTPPTVAATTAPAATTVKAEVKPPEASESLETKFVAAQTATSKPAETVELVKPAEEAAIVQTDIEPEKESFLQWQQLKDEIIKILSDLPNYLSNFYQHYKKPINITAAILTSYIALRLVVAVVEAVETVPLLAFGFELIGVGYSVWFVYRYLLRASERQELSETIKALKEEILGRDS